MDISLKGLGSILSLICFRLPLPDQPASACGTWCNNTHPRKLKWISKSTLQNCLFLQWGRFSSNFVFAQSWLSCFPVPALTEKEPARIRWCYVDGRIPAGISSWLTPRRVSLTTFGARDDEQGESTKAKNKHWRPSLFSAQFRFSPEFMSQLKSCGNIIFLPVSLLWLGVFFQFFFCPVVCLSVPPSSLCYFEQLLFSEKKNSNFFPPNFFFTFAPFFFSISGCFMPFSVLFRF